MKYFLTFAFLFISLFAFSQSSAINIDERLFDSHEEDYLKRLENQHPSILSYLNFSLDNLWEIQTYPEGKLADIEIIEFEKQDVKTVQIFSLIKKYNLKRAFDHQMLYRLNKSNKVLVILSGQELAEKFNLHTNRIH